MKYLKKALLLLITLLVVVVAAAGLMNYDVIDRLLERGPSYDYATSTLCISEDDSKIVLAANGQYRGKLEKARQNLLKLKEEYSIPGLAICVAKNDSIIWNEGFGCENLEEKRPVTTATLFRVGSVSKSMTGIALMKLVQNRKLDLNQTVESVLPSFPKKEYPIRVKELANHQSGIRHYKGLEMVSNISYNSIDKSLDVFKNDKLSFKPGTEYQYSSYNYVLLSKIIEELTKQNYLDFMKNEVFLPLGMKATVPGKKIKKTVGYTSNTNNGKIRKAIEVDVSNKWAGGGFISTPRDLVLMHTKLDSVLTSEYQKVLFEPQKFSDGEETGTDYAIGFRNTFLKSKKRTLIHHGGSSVGGRAFLLKIVEENFVIAICANSDTGLLRPNNYDLQQVYDIAKIFL